MGEVESAKTVSDLIAPVTGRVVESNDILEAKPELLNESPYDDGWIAVVDLADSDSFDALMTAEEYASERSS